MMVMSETKYVSNIQYNKDDLRSDILIRDNGYTTTTRRREMPVREER